MNDFLIHLPFDK